MSPERLRRLTSLPWSPGFLPSKQLTCQLHRAEVPPEQPVEEGGVVVASLVCPLVTNGESVGDLEQRSLVRLQQLGPEEVSTLLKDARQHDDGRAPLLNGGVAGPEQGDGMGEAVDRLGCCCPQRSLRKLIQPGRFDPDEPTDVLTAVGQP